MMERRSMRGNMACDEKIDEFHRRHTPNEVDMAPMYRIINPAANTPPLSVVNTVDNVNTVEDFTYINSCKYSKSVPVPADMLFPCECDGGCRNDCPCVEKQYYDDNGRVRVGHEEPIFECSEQCTCGPECPSRVVQRGSAIQFEIFRLPQKGWGVRAKHKVERGTFIIEYVGEIIDYDEVERRGIEDRKAGNTYLFDLDSDYSANEIADFSIDARRYGNISRFFNHSCDPNMAIWSVYIEHHDPRLPRLVFFAIRDIEEDEELTLDYNPGESCEGRLESPCYCGSSNCRKQIFF
ncbi:hypothetical protein EC988_000373 [Linderina pennispora]|nr:hypothetical protein EC988_000373 [Linderina pennispora]